jgi:CO dehydrogenase maturation factor
MPYSIAIAGKGGTGKTTLSALITTHFVNANRTPILAVDADPNANLNEALGLEYDTSVVDTVDRIMSDGADAPAGVPKGRMVEYEVHDALVESTGFDLLVMGRTEGPGCYCYANDLLKGFLEKLSASYSIVVMDNEAGMEHLSRRTTRNVNVLLIVANPSVTALRSAGRIHKLVQDLKLGIGQTYLVLNRINAASGPVAAGSVMAEKLSELDAAGLPLLGEVAYDEDVVARSQEADGVMDVARDSPALAAVGEMMAQLAG